ncbi:glycosyltransferase family 39 protein [Prolixibacteraceae bacterium Z1-6]|uniref:Glycosyltransferase family 39 protein n=1 Tax=Draconibacterium aestuarii TaxID=2998507 RepID=A0A9X3F852_9BACT|nr:glycosyltransferase family 39 protein [Prolixibacteraceae bacterium Z1-6]
MFKNNTARILFFCAVAIGVWAYFAGLAIDFTRDAGKYATVAKEIFQNGNYINLTVHGQAYDQKPPLLFWMGALGFTIGGISNFWFKLPVLLLVFAGFYWAFQLGKSLYNRRVGMFTAVFLFFSLIYSLYSMDIHTDTPFQAFVTLALWQLFEFIKTKRDKHWIVGFAAIGLSMLCKGPLGGILVAFAVLGHLLLRKDFRFLLNIRWYLGAVLAFVVASPALIGLWNQFGWEGIRFFFWDNNVGRITGSYVQAVNDPIFYVHSLAYLLLPWSLMFFISAFSEIRHLIRSRFRANEYFTFTGIWIFFVIINASSSQLPNYVFGVVPLMAVLIAKWVDIALIGKSKLLKVFGHTQTVVVIILWNFIVLILGYLFPVHSVFVLLLSIIGGVITVYLRYKVREEVAKLLMPSIVTFSVLMFLFNVHVYPYMFGFQAPPKAARYFNEHAKPGDTLYNYKYPQYELFFYSEPQAKQIYSDEEMEQIAGVKGSWVFTDPDGLIELDKLTFEPDTIIEYKHLYLNRGGRFVNPKTRDDVLQPMYLIKY